MHGRNTARRCFPESGAVELRRPTITTTHFWPCRRAIYIYGRDALPRYHYWSRLHNSWVSLRSFAAMLLRRLPAQSSQSTNAFKNIIRRSKRAFQSSCDIFQQATKESGKKSFNLVSRYLSRRLGNRSCPGHFALHLLSLERFSSSGGGSWLHLQEC